MKLLLDTDRCVGHGRCYSLAPDVFDCDDEGHAVLLVTDIGPELAAQAELGVQNCPEGALSLQAD